MMDPAFDENLNTIENNEIMLKIQSVTVLRNRENAKIVCNPVSFQDDKILLEQAVNQFNCTTKYPG